MPFFVDINHIMIEEILFYILYQQIFYHFIEISLIFVQSFIFIYFLITNENIQTFFIILIDIHSFE
jgi:hypothetical protein